MQWWWCLSRVADCVIAQLAAWPLREGHAAGCAFGNNGRGEDLLHVGPVRFIKSGPGACLE